MVALNRRCISGGDFLTIAEVVNRSQVAKGSGYEMVVEVVDGAGCASGC